MRSDGSRAPRARIRWFKLPEECRGQGVIAEYRDGNLLYIYPWRNMHYIGPTDTLFDGYEDEVRATDEEIDFLLDEVNHLLPGLGGLTRDALCFTWAGVRLQTSYSASAMGVCGRVVHGLTGDGMPGMLALTGSNIITHRLSGRELCTAVKARLAPSGTPALLSYDAKPLEPAPESPNLLNHWDGARLAHLRQAAGREHPVNLADLLFRRLGAGWTETMARPGAATATLRCQRRDRSVSWPISWASASLAISPISRFSPTRPWPKWECRPTPSNGPTGAARTWIALA